MHMVWYSLIMVATLLPLLYLIGTMINDLSQDIRKKKVKKRIVKTEKNLNSRYRKTNLRVVK